MYISGYIGNPVLRFLYNFFVQLPLQIWFRFITALVPSNAVFINYTSVSDAELKTQWMVAQHQLASAPFPLNDMGSALHAADPRALTVQPKHVTVVAVPDVQISDLAKLNAAWSKDKDPSGTIIFISGGINYTTCHALTCPWRKPRVYAAASEVPTVLSYEFENIILDKLGYDVSAR